MKSEMMEMIISIKKTLNTLEKKINDEMDDEIGLTAELKELRAQKRSWEKLKPKYPNKENEIEEIATRIFMSFSRWTNRSYQKNGKMKILDYHWPIIDFDALDADARYYAEKMTYPDGRLRNNAQLQGIESLIWLRVLKKTAAINKSKMPSVCNGAKK